MNTLNYLSIKKDCTHTKVSPSMVSFGLFTIIFIFCFPGNVKAQTGTVTYGVGSGTQGSYNAFFGYYAGHLNTWSYNTFVGNYSGRNHTTGHYNTFLGSHSGYYSYGNSNILIGWKAGYRMSSSSSNNVYIGNASASGPTSAGGFKNGSYNVALGAKSGGGDASATYNFSNSVFLGYASFHQGDFNTLVGSQSGGGGARGSMNTMVGYRAGRGNSGSGNLFLGYQAGSNETSSNKLYIDNSSTSSPLIWGDFAANSLKINGSLQSTGNFVTPSIDASTYDVNSGNGNGLRFWNSDNYKIHMGNSPEYKYGPVQDYSIKNNMNNDTDRGWTWGVTGSTPIAAISTQGNMQIKGDFTTERHIYGRRVNSQYSNLYRFGGIFFTWDSDSYGTNTHHSIRSTYGDSYGDHITMNSFGHIRFNFDSNNNGTNVFQIGHSTTGTGNVLFHLDESGKLGLGTSSPAEKLHVNGAMRGHVSGGAVRIQSTHGYVDIGPQNTGWSHFSTDRSRFYFNKGITVDEGLIGSYNQDLQLQTSGNTAVTIDNTNQNVTVSNNLIVGGTLKLDRTGGNIPPDDNVEDLMVLKEDGTLAFRDVRSIESPWLLDSLGAGLINVGCDPDVLGDCEINVFDLNGNLRIGDNSVLDDDMEYGGLGDDWMKFSGYIELSTAVDAGDKGLVLLDRSDNLSFLNLLQKGNTSYFSNSQDANEDGYFLKSVGRDVEFGGETRVPTLISETFEASNQVKLSLSTDSSKEEVLVTGSDGIVHKRSINSFSPWSLNADNSYSTLNRLGIGEPTPQENSTLSVSSSSDVGLYLRNTNTSSTTYGLRSEVFGRNVKAIAAVDATSGQDVFRVFGNGIVEAKEVLVSLDIWNDHVFYPEYNLMPLDEVEAFVNEKHHLPEIPSEKEVLENGVNLGEMDALLIKKVEELTLYIIEQNKQLKEQASVLKQQSEKIEKLEQKLGE